MNYIAALFGVIDKGTCENGISTIFISNFIMYVHCRCGKRGRNTYTIASKRDQAELLNE